MAGASKRKAMEQDVDTDDLEERAMMQQPRCRFSELEPIADQGNSQHLARSLSSPHAQDFTAICTYAADQLDDEMPGSVRADATAVQPNDLLLPNQQNGQWEPMLSCTKPPAFSLLQFLQWTSGNLHLSVCDQVTSTTSLTIRTLRWQIQQ